MVTPPNLKKDGRILPVSESPRGFVTAPTLDQLKPTERERHLLKVLWDWQEQSAKSQIVLGQPTHAYR